MFMRFKKKGTAYSVIKETEKHVLEGYPFYTGCSKDMLSFVKDFFEKIKNLDIDWDNTKITIPLIETAEIVWNLSLNCIINERITQNNLEAIRKIFDMINKIVESILEEKEISSKMLYCISQVLFMNMINRNIKRYDIDYKKVQDGMIFKDFNNLYQIIYKIFNEWEALNKRGLESQQLTHLKESFDYDRKTGNEKSEQEKFDMLIGILNGTMKFKPIYRAVAYQIVPIKHDEKLFEDNLKYVEYSLIPKHE